MKWQLLPLKKHILLLFSLWQTQPFKNLTFSSDLQIQKDCCCVIYPGFLHEALCLFYYAWELWLRGVKTFYCGFVCSNDQDVPTRGLCNGGGERENSVFAPPPVLVRTPRTQWHWELYLHVKCVAANPKMKATCQKLLPEEQLHKWDSH